MFDKKLPTDYQIFKDIYDTYYHDFVSFDPDNGSVTLFL